MYSSQEQDPLFIRTQKLKQSINFPELLGLDGVYEHEGAYPPHDHCGYKMAATILLHSRRPGR